MFNFFIHEDNIVASMSLINKSAIEVEEPVKANLNSESIIDPCKNSPSTNVIG